MYWLAYSPPPTSVGLAEGLSLASRKGRITKRSSSSTFASQRSEDSTFASVVGIRTILPLLTCTRQTSLERLCSLVKITTTLVFISLLALQTTSG